MQTLKPDPRSITILLIIFSSSLVVKNGFLNLLALLIAWLGIRLLWRPHLSPVFIFIFLYSWIQSSIKIFEANILNIEIGQVSAIGGSIDLASALTLIGIAMLAMGVHLGLRSKNSFMRNDFSSEIDSRPPLFWFYCYAAATTTALLLQAFASVVPGLSQPFNALANLKWGFYWILTQVAFRKPGKVGWLWSIVFLVEFFIGIGGYFSGFKTVIFFTILGLLSSGIRITRLRAALLAILVSFLLAFGVIWTAIKNEHRGFLNLGSESQIVSVSFQDSIHNIWYLIEGLNKSDISNAFMLLIDRVAYVELFGKVIDTVPSQSPHEKGELWGDAIVRPFMPRMLFPEKPIIDESLRSMEYTGINFAGIDQGTQVSLGYIADSYIDFGPFLMMLPIISLGWIIGRYYRWIVNMQCCRGIIGASLGTATLFQISSIEISNTKLTGGLIVGALMSWLVAIWIIPMFYKPPNTSFRAPSLRIW